MSKASTPHRRVEPKINKAEQLRQQKQKKIDDSNLRVSKQLERSADSWQNSIEQIRKIARKAQDSSQIVDNVFNENENDRSEYESGPFTYNSDHQRSNGFDVNQSNLYKRQIIQPTPQNPDMYRPLSIYANNSNINHQRTSDFYNNFRGNFNTYYPASNMNSNNIYTCPTTPIPRYFNSPNLFNTWQPRQPNHNFSNSIRTPMHLYQYPYGNRLMHPNYFGYNYYPQYPQYPQYTQYPQYPLPLSNPNLNLNLNPNPNPVGHNFYNNNNESSITSIESMKKYVNTLLDKLEVLNDTVAKLKNASITNHNCSHENYTRLAPPKTHYHSVGSCLNRHPSGCHCSEMEYVNRSHSSMSHRHRMCLRGRVNPTPINRFNYEPHYASNSHVNCSFNRAMHHNHTRGYSCDVNPRYYGGDYYRRNENDSMGFYSRQGEAIYENQNSSSIMSQNGSSMPSYSRYNRTNTPHFNNYSQPNCSSQPREPEQPTGSTSPIDMHTVTM